MHITVRAFVLALTAVALVAVITTVALLFTVLRGNPPAGPPNTVGPSAAAPAAPTPPTSQPPPVVAAPPLDGTYRLDKDYSQETINGQLSAQAPDTKSIWMGFRSSCTSAGCVATGTVLDSENLQAPLTPDINYVLHWINGRWQSDDRTYQTTCFRPFDADDPLGGKGHETSISTMSFEPQPNGTYRGTERWIVQTSECGLQGNVYVLPFVAWRTGPTPAGVVAEPPK